LSSKKPNISALVTSIAEPILQPLKLTLWDVLFVKEGSSFILRIIIDKPNGLISINDCETVTKAIDPILDELDPIDTSYILEISSPGINRILKKTSHFNSCINKKISVKLIRPFNNKREFTGILKEYNNNVITILPDDGNVLNFEKKLTSSVSLCDEQ
jgi:Uncharacterized protein conserved in bacteria